MNIGDLKARIGDYLQVSFRPTGEPDPDPLILAKLDELALLALNNARKSAERTHDFLAAERRVVVTIGENGGDLSGALLWVPGGTPTMQRNIKNILGAWSLSDTAYPCNPISVISGSRQWVEKWEQDKNSRIYRYPTDQQADVVSRSDIYLYTSGDTLWFDNNQGGEDVDVLLDVSVWLDDYVDDGDEDWFTANGSDYLMWAGIVECNYLFQTFVPRQEGSVPMPTSVRDRSLQQLVMLDNFRREGGRLNDQN